MIIEPFKPEHVQEIDVQSEQSLAQKHLQNADYLRALEKAESFTGRIDGRIVACAGIITIWPGRYQCWALISATIGATGMVALTRAVRRFIALKSGRMEMVVAAEFEAGQRWAKLLGFDLETPKPMRNWFPEGGDASLYSRVS